MTLDDLQMTCEAMCSSPYRAGSLEVEVAAMALKLLAVARAAALLKIGDGCWCEVATGNPNYRGQHSRACKAMAEALQATESEKKP